jgi:hypothetical protein
MPSTLQKKTAEIELFLINFLILNIIYLQNIAFFYCFESVKIQKNLKEIKSKIKS